MSGEDAGTIAGRLPPAPAPAEPRAIFESCPECGSAVRAQLVPDWMERVEAGAAIPIVGCGNPWHVALDEQEQADAYARGRADEAAELGPGGIRHEETLASVQATAEKLDLLYVPEQHRLHAHAKEECNTDSSSGKRRIREEDLAKVSPDVALCEHCVSPAEARIIRAGLRRV